MGCRRNGSAGDAVHQVHRRHDHEFVGLTCTLSLTLRLATDSFHSAQMPAAAVPGIGRHTAVERCSKRPNSGRVLKNPRILSSIAFAALAHPQ